MLSPRESFKAGFLTKCAEAGLNQDETIAVARLAIARLESSSKEASFGEVVKTTAGLGTKAMLWPLFAVPGAALGAGYSLAHFTDLDDEDVDTVRKRELADLYQTYARQLQMQPRVVPRG